MISPHPTLDVTRVIVVLSVAGAFPIFPAADLAAAFDPVLLGKPVPLVVVQVSLEVVSSRVSVLAIPTYFAIFELASFVPVHSVVFIIDRQVALALEFHLVVDASDPLLLVVVAVGVESEHDVILEFALTPDALVRLFLFLKLLNSFPGTLVIGKVALVVAVFELAEPESFFLVRFLVPDLFCVVHQSDFD
eukprot:CAMPEP_0116894812 /NCGR_PEP_ID=MMETSP0467-20121206/4495_1 /TAXON_ID=283647 /ORGANISM="Mesodinium pulex, Strain SPMC105" /LENGTH=190 /DNA_ID=CAMNT_0004565235 /DNA_START=566 /DNA_END=1138 /DNA_ORIENTATION=+